MPQAEPNIENGDICTTCKKPAATGPSSLTQWIFGRDQCTCQAKTFQFLRVKASASPKVTECSICDREIRPSDGTMTQWIFHSRYCACASPSPKAAVAETGDQANLIQTYRLESDLARFNNIGDDNLAGWREELSRYIPSRHLGRGGAGSVFLCKDTLLSKLVAVKILRHITSQSVISFQMEAKIASRLVHPGIVRIIDFGVTDSSYPYMVMEAVCGISLKDRLIVRGPLSEYETRLIGTRLARALAYAHSCGTLHRDIKSTNIIIREDTAGDLDPILIDFGIAKFYEETLAGVGSESQSMVGTPEYMAPDTVLSKAYSEATEVYSLGCVLFEALTGKVPFQGEGSLETLAMHMNYKPPTLCEARSDLSFSSEIENIVSRCLEKNPSMRFQSMVALEKALWEGEGSPTRESMEPGGSSTESTRETGNRVLPTPARLSSARVISAAVLISLTGAMLLFGISRFAGSPEKGRGSASVKGDPSAQKPKNADEMKELFGRTVDIEKLVERGRSGDMAAQKDLGIRYFTGTGGAAQDYQKAFQWFQVPAQKGDARAQYYLGVMYGHGWGVKTNNKEAMKWLLLAAQQGDFKAENEIGCMYVRGQAEGKDFQKAMQWFRRSAEKGNPEAYCNIGQMYSDGLGVNGNYQEALKWYRMAANQGYAEGQNKVSICYRYGLGVKKNFEKAFAWSRKAAEQGNASGQHDLAYFYIKGLGVELNNDEGAKWMRRAADQGLPLAQNDLGTMYLNGTGVEANPREALKWWRKAAAGNVAAAETNVGFAYQQGMAVEKSYEKALEWYRRGAAHGDVHAYSALAVMYSTGRGVKKDPVEAERWIDRGRKLQRSRNWLYQKE